MKNNKVEKKKIPWRICKKCGDELFPNAKIEGAITVSLGKCERCGAKGVTLIPTRDFRTENKDVDWD